MDPSAHHRRASEIFRSVIELPDEEREPFLRSACQGNGELLKEVLSLLAHDAPEPTLPTLHDETAPLESSIPRTFGKYEILGEIGHGGQGFLLQARDMKLDRMVALKFLPPDLERIDSARRRFVREGQAASRLKHDGIATVYEAGDSDGRSYIAFEFVDGTSVSKRLAAGPFPAVQAVRATVAAARALAHAHERSVFHRDVSSNNLMITGDGRVVVVDFGLAVAHGVERLTRSGSAMGTVPYMAPEALRGEITQDDLPANRLVDVYGLGITLYEMLTGSVPFRAPALPQLMYAITTEEAERPSQLVPALPTELDEVVLKAIAKSPAKRYQSMHEFADALEILLLPGLLPTIAPSQEFVRMPRESTGPPPRPGRDRKRLVVLTAIPIVVVAILLATGVIPLPFPAGTAFSSVAVLPFEVTGPDTSIPTWLTSGLARETVAKLSKVDRVRVVTWASSQRYSPSESRLKEIAANLGVEALVIVSIERKADHLIGRIELVNGKDESVRWTGTFDQPERDLLSIQTAMVTGVARGILGDLSQDMAGTLAMPAARSAEAYELYLRGAEALQDDTRESSEIALGHFERALELDPNLADAMVGIGAVKSNQYFYGEGGSQQLAAARRFFDQALSVAPQNRDALRGLITVLYESLQPVEGLKLATRASDGPNASVEDLLVRGQAYTLSGLPEKAVPALRRAAATEPSNPAILWWLVIAECWAGQYEECIRDGELLFQRFGEDPEIHLWMAEAYTGLGDLDSAIIHARREVEMFSARPHDYTEYHLVRLYQRVGMDAEANRLVRIATARLERVISAYPDNYRYAMSLAECYSLLADTTRFLDTVRTLPNEISEPSRLADSLCRLGMMEEAREVLCTLVESGKMDISGRVRGGINLATCGSDPEVKRCYDLMLRNFDELAERY